VGSIVIVALLALLALVLAAWPFLRRRDHQRPADAEPASDLRHELETRYEAIAELDEDLAANRLSAEDHSRLKAELERGAAALLARIEASESDRAKPAPRQTRERSRKAEALTPPRSSPKPSLLAAGAILILLLGLALGLLLPRLFTSSPSKAGPDDRQAQFERALQQHSSDVKALLALGHAALDEGQGLQAVQAYKNVLDLEPKNAEALTHIGILLAQGGHVEQALAHFDKALAVQPTYSHALWDKAHILYQMKQDYRGAIATWERFLEINPSGEDADRARALIIEAKGRALLSKQNAGAERGK
jgi:cytochrome c-type biogenesis protein CcmI